MVQFAVAAVITVFAAFYQGVIISVRCKFQINIYLIVKTQCFRACCMRGRIFFGEDFGYQLSEPLLLMIYEININIFINLCHSFGNLIDLQFLIIHIHKSLLSAVQTIVC